MFRMRTAGYRGPDLFSNSVVGHVARASHGLTRRVNLIADKALLAAFSENTHTIRPRHVEAAVRDSEFSQRATPQSGARYLWGMAVFAAGAAVGIAAYLMVGFGTQGSPHGAIATIPGARLSSPANQPEAEPLAAPMISTQDIDSTTKYTVGDALEAPLLVAAATPVIPGSEGDGKMPAAVEASTTETATSVAGDLLETRLAATQKWLATEVPNTYSIQLLGTTDAQQLKLHFHDLSKFVEMNEIYVYRTDVNGRPLLTVLYGNFSDRRSAQQVLSKLPQGLRANRPILRTVEGVRAEIKRH